jgi:hypothetical protein
MSIDSIENMLITCAEDDVRTDARRGLGHARSNELGVLLAAAFATSSRCGSGPTRTEVAPAPSPSHRASKTSPCAATTTRLPPTRASPPPVASAWAVP